MDDRKVLGIGSGHRDNPWQTLYDHVIGSPACDWLSECVCILVGGVEGREGGGGGGGEEGRWESLGRSVPG